MQIFFSSAKRSSCQYPVDSETGDFTSTVVKSDWILIASSLSLKLVKMPGQVSPGCRSIFQAQPLIMSPTWHPNLGMVESSTEHETMADSKY